MGLFRCKEAGEGEVANQAPANDTSQQMVLVTPELCREVFACCPDPLEKPLGWSLRGVPTLRRRSNLSIRNSGGSATDAERSSP